MKNSLCKKFMQMFRCEQGNVVIIVAFAILMLLLCAGTAIDMSRVQAAKAKLSTCLDTAGLAGISKISSVPQNMTVTQWVTQNVTQYFNVNCNANKVNYTLDAVATITNISLSADQNTLTLDAQATQPTKLMPLVGINGVTVTAHSVVKRASDNGLEVVLLLDNTGSMQDQVDPGSPGSSSKIVALQQAAASLVNILLGTNGTPPANAWIGIIPFAQAVNIGGSDITSGNTNLSWVNFGNPVPDYGPTSGSNSTCDSYKGQPPVTSSSKGYKYCTYKNNGKLINFQNTHWDGCVSARSSPDDISEATPGSIPYPPFYFSPITDNATPPPVVPTPMYIDSSNIMPVLQTEYPQSQYPQLTPSLLPSFSNPWKMYDTTNDKTTYITPLLDVLYPAPSSPPYYPYGPNTYCTTPVTIMTQNSNTLIAGINAMTPNGDTIFPPALQWSWAMLSPNWQGAWGGSMAANGLPKAYNTPGNAKVMLFMTDGYNHFFPGNYTSYGQLIDGVLGTTDETKAETELDNRTLDICTNMKSKGIIIFTIGFGKTDGVTVKPPKGQVPDVNGALLQACATDAKKTYFLATTNQTLQNVFQAIAQSLLNPRVAQ